MPISEADLKANSDTSAWDSIFGSSSTSASINPADLKGGFEGFTEFPTMIAGHAIMWSVTPLLILTILLGLSLMKVYTNKINNKLNASSASFILPFSALLAALLIWLALHTFYSFAFINLDVFDLQKMIFASNSASFAHFPKTQVVEIMSTIIIILSGLLPFIYAFIYPGIVFLGLALSLEYMPTSTSDYSAFAKIASVLIVMFCSLVVAIFVNVYVDITLFGGGEIKFATWSQNELGSLADISREALKWTVRSAFGE
jgi:hypothetical protein